MTEEVFDLQSKPLAALTQPRNAEELRQIFGCFPTGVTALCALVSGRPVGMTASSFTAVSLDPPLVSVCIRNSSKTWPRLRPASRLGISVLAQSHEAECQQLARPGGDRFDDIAWERHTGDAIVLAGASASMSCTVYAEVPSGDHAIVLFNVCEATASPTIAPLVFHGSGFRQLAIVGAPGPGIHTRGGL